MLTVCTLVATPTAALAGGSGGAGIGGGGSTPAPASTPPISVSPAPASIVPGVVELGGVLNASGDGISLTVAASGTQGRPLTISGEAPTADAGAPIYVEAVKAGRSTWTRAAATTIAANGGFTAQWTPSSNGQVELRAVLEPAGGGSDANGSAGLSSAAGGSASAAAGEIATSALTIPIFRNAVATLYGPGFWGHRTACGERLTHATLGVASRTLKCGTEVAVLYGGHELTVPVIDRGPFTRHVRWDLTMATARALGIRQTATVGTLTGALALAFAAGH